MTLEDVKKQIDSKDIKNSFIIFECDNTFIPKQYYTTIANIKNIPIQYIEDINNISNNINDIFGFKEDNVSLRILNTDNFSIYEDRLKKEENLIIICKKVDESTKSIYNNYIVQVKSIPYWCVKDYCYSMLKGVDSKFIDWLIDNCNADINRLQMEIDKITLFTRKERPLIIKEMLEDNAFCDISNKTIFDFTNSILNRNFKELSNLYEDIDNIDIESLGVVTLLYRNFMNFIKVWMTNNPTPENTQLSSKQIYAINKLPRIWSKEQLVNIVKFLSDIDYRLKIGSLPMENLRDYIMIKVISGC